MNAAEVSDGSKAYSRRANTGPQHLAFIDALRGIAFLGVFVAHATLCVAGLPHALVDFLGRGSSGVQLFYALSAFTLCASLHARDGEQGVIAKYFLRRIFRILPMFWFAIVLYIFVDMYVTPAIYINEHVTNWGLPHGFRNAGQIVLAAFLLHGFNPYALNGIVPAGWSVAIEAQFYLVLPLLFAYATTLRRALILVAASIVLSIIYQPVAEGLLAPFYPASDRGIVHEFAYFSLATQLPMFMMGLLAYRLLGPDRATLTRIEAAVPLRPIAFGAVLVAILPLRHNFPGHIGFGVMSLALIYICAASRFVFADNRFTRFFGKISYSAYLLHFAVLFLIETYGTPLLGAEPFSRLVIIVIVGLSILAAFALATYLLIEQPGIAFGRLIARRLIPLKTAEESAFQTA